MLSDHETGGLALRGTGKGIDWQPMIDQWNSNKPKDSCAEIFSGAMDNTEFARKILRAVGAAQ